MDSLADGMKKGLEEIKSLLSTHGTELRHWSVKCILLVIPTTTNSWLLGRFFGSYGRMWQPLLKTWSNLLRCWMEASARPWLTLLRPLRSSATRIVIFAQMLSHGLTGLAHFGVPSFAFITLTLAVSLIDTFPHHSLFDNAKRGESREKILLSFTLYILRNILHVILCMNSVDFFYV